MTCEEEDSPYEGVVWSFKSISIRDTVFENVKVKFEYDIIDDPFNKTEFNNAQEKTDFENFLGDCLLQLVTETNENRNNNSEEPSEP